MNENLKKLFDILLSNNPSILIRENEDYIFNIIPELRKSKGFNQNNPWHIYDVYDHILHVIDGVKENIIFAIAIKIIVLILGACGGATMWEAVFADVGVSILAIINSLRMLK